MAGSITLVVSGDMPPGLIAQETRDLATTLGRLSMTTLLPGWSHTVTDINAGLLAVILNVVTMVLVSRLSSTSTVPGTV